MIPHALTEAFVTVVDVSWRGAAFLAVVLLLRRMLRGRVPAQVWCFGWLVLAGRLLLPVSIPLPWLARGGDPAAKVLSAVSPIRNPAADAAALGDSPMVVSPVSEPVHEPDAGPKGKLRASSPSWREVFALVWLAGLGLLLAIRFVGTRQFRQRLRTARASVDGRLRAALEREALMLGLRQVVRCDETDAVEMPALHGLFRPRLLFPAGLAARLNDEELRLVVRHELAHVRRRDLLAQALVHTAAVVHWFNPLAWIAARLARHDCELACDEAVLARETPADAHAYGATLLKVLDISRAVTRPRAFVLGILETRRELVQRLRRIAGYQGARALPGAAAAGAIAVLALTSALRPVVAAETVPVERKSVASTTKDAAGSLELSGSAQPPTGDLASALEAQKGEVDRLTRELQDFQQSKRGPSLDTRRDLTNQALQAAARTATQKQQEFARLDLRVKQIADYRARHADLTALPFVGSDPAVAQARLGLATLQAEEAGLAQRYGDQHPALMNLRATIAQTKQTLSSAIDAACATTEAARELAERELAAARQELERSSAESLELDQLASEYLAKDRALRTQQQMVETLQARLAETLAAQKATTVFTVSVVGAVNRQGAIEFGATEKPIVLEAIARAGGFTPEANRTALRLIRREADGTRSNRTLAEDDVMLGIAPEVQLRAGDVIVVPEKAPVAAAIVSVTGQVTKPGRFTLPEGSRVSIVEVIAMAGGPSRLADMKRVRITSRRGPRGEGSTMLVDLSKLFSPGANGAEPQADVEVQAGDMIFVPERIL